LLGAEIFAEDINSNYQNNIKIETKNWNNGTYFLALETEKTIYTNTFIVKK
jgi:hypothetical protein